MSSIASDYCGDDISDYACSDMSYEYSDDEQHEGSLSACEQSNKAHEYDGESYEGYDGPRDYDRHGDENYYTGDEYEMHGAYGSYDEHKRVEVSYDEFDSEDEGYGGSHITHHGDEDDVRYNSFSYMSCEPFEEGCDRRGCCGDELPSSSYVTSYPSRGGIDVWAKPI